MKRFYYFSFIIVVLVLFSSCATVFKGTRQKIEVSGNTSQPVNLIVDGKNYSNVTLPSHVKIKRKRKPSRIAAYSDNHQLRYFELEKKSSPIIYCNILGLGLSLGTIPIDLLTGAHRYTKQKDVTFNFEDITNKRELSDTYIKVGNEYVRNKNHKQARIFFQKAINTDEENEAAYARMESFDNYLAFLEKEKARKEEAWNNFFNTATAVLSTANQIVEQTSGTSSSDSYAGNSSYGGNSNEERMYRSWEKRAQEAYSSLTNLGVSVTTKGGDHYGNTGGVKKLSGSNYTLQKKNLREAQNQMKKIRNDAARKGISIRASRWETASVSY